MNENLQSKRISKSENSRMKLRPRKFVLMVYRGLWLQEQTLPLMSKAIRRCAGIEAGETVFVAGNPADLPGASGVSVRVFGTTTLTWRRRTMSSLGERVQGWTKRFEGGVSIKHAHIASPSSNGRTTAGDDAEWWVLTRLSYRYAIKERGRYIAAIFILVDLIGKHWARSQRLSADFQKVCVVVRSESGSTSIVSRPPRFEDQQNRLGWCTGAIQVDQMKGTRLRRRVLNITS